MNHADLLPEKIHIVGLSGIGVSALAGVLRARGAVISGSDVETGGHRATNVPEDAKLLIYSNAVPEDNPERVRARELGLAEMSYPQALGQFCHDRKLIAVSGTNGKTTTTAMIGWIMDKAGLDPTVIVGSRVLDWGQNFRAGKGEWVVIEADEYKRAFLNYEPDIAVITNIAPDHLDYYQDLEDIKNAFTEFAGRVKKGGTLVVNIDDENASSAANVAGGQIVSFASSGAQYKLQMPGAFNRANAAAAAAVCRLLGISQNTIEQAIASFRGTWRRFERAGQFGSTEIISDYAHHPDGVRATLEGAGEVFDPKKVLVVFQPHQHNRTKKLFSEFVSAFADSQIDDFIFAEIFDVAGREESEDQDVSSKDLATEIQKRGKKVSYAKDLNDAEDQVKKIADQFEAIIVMGAGDVYKVADKLVSSK